MELVLLTIQLSVVDYQILDKKGKLVNSLLLLQRCQESRGIVEVLDEKSDKRQINDCNY